MDRIEEKGIILLGGGGHAKVIADIFLESDRNHIIGIVGNEGDTFWGIPNIGKDEELGMIRKKYPDAVAFSAVGNNHLRGKLTEKLLEAGFEICNALSTRAIVSPRAVIGKGVAIMPGAIINADAVVEDGCIINTNASIDHEVKMGCFSHAAPGVSVSGKTEIGSFTMVGTGARVIDGIKIGNNAIIGAGAAVVKDIASDSVAVGVPAKVVKRIG